MKPFYSLSLTLLLVVTGCSDPASESLGGTSKAESGKASKGESSEKATSKTDEAVADRKVVSFMYVLTDKEGKLIDQSEKDKPLSYIHGIGGGIIPGLAAEMVGKKVGDEFEAVIPPEEAYGLMDESLAQDVPREDLAQIGELKVGMQLQGPKGVGTIKEIGAETVKIDFNHALAGKTLTFKISVMDIRDATDEEVLHGHAHGPGGIDH